MTSTTPLSHDFFSAKSHDEPDLFNVGYPALNMKPVNAAINPKDPQNFLKRCSGYSKKTNLRCSVSISKKAQKDHHITYLPTCGAHRDQQSLAGWCQFKSADGDRCGTLFRWTPPHFELCDNHQGHPSTPCHFLKQLPLELRHEIYRYLLPTEPIDSSTAAMHDQSVRDTHQAASRSPVRSCGPYPSPVRSTRMLRSKFPMRLLDLLMVSRQVHTEVKNLLFNIVTFKIDIRQDGTFMCGRRLLEPKRADGSSHFFFGQLDHAKKEFLRSFDWASAKNYTVDVLLENCPIANPQQAPNNVNLAMKSRWDEEVEIYDIRDYISVVVSGILAKATRLNKLHVRLCVADFAWNEEQILSNAKLLFSPFERLRNVRQPQIVGVYNGRPENNSMYPLERGTGQNLLPTLNGCIRSTLSPYYELCSVPSLPTDEPVLSAGMPTFDSYVSKWARQISSESSANVVQEPMIRKMFTEFRNFYTELSCQVPDVTLKCGRHTFLHRARVAREQEDVIAFRAIRKELLEYWEKYLDTQERKKRTMEARIAKFLQSDTYPSDTWEDPSPTQEERSSATTQGLQSSIVLDSDVIARDGIPMTGNMVRQNYHQPRMGQNPALYNSYLYPTRPDGVPEKRDVRNMRQLQAQVLQQEVIRQRMQLKQLQDVQQYLKASAMPQQCEYLTKRKATDEMNEIHEQPLPQTEPTSGATVQPSRDSSLSQVGYDTTLPTILLHETSDNNMHCTNNLSATPSTTDMACSLEGEPGPSTKRRRINSAPDGAVTASSSMAESGSRSGYEIDGTCDMHPPTGDLNAVEQVSIGKGKEKV